MKRTLVNYTFNAALKTVTLTDFGTIRLESILLITNVTRNIVIYQLTDPTKGGTVATNVLTLAFNTTAQANADSLNIVFEDFVSGGFVSTLNSTATNLALNAAFTGTGEDVSAFSNIKVGIFSSHISAVDGLQMQQSSNNVDWDASDVYSIPATSNKTFSVPVNLKFFRIVYTNGAVATTAFRLQVIFSIQDKQPSSVRPQDGRSNENDFVETVSALMGYNSTANAWNRIGISNATTGGNENLIDRIKINASLRMIDNAQPSGTKLVGVTGTQASGLDVNIKNTSLPVTGTFFQATQPVSIPSDADNTSTGTLAAATQTVVLTMGGKSAVGIVITGTWVGTITFEGSVDGTNFNSINAVAASTSTPQSTTVVNGLFRLTPAGLLQVRVIMTAFTSGTATVSMRASAGTGGIFANQVVPVTVVSSPASNLVVTVTAASGVAVTLTLPAVAGLFHYITSIDILIYATAVRTGAATPLIVTTTNITGSPAFTFETAQAIGTNTPIQGYSLITPLKSAVVNTATTIVAPVATAGIWRITVTYFVGA